MSEDANKAAAPAAEAESKAPAGGKMAGIIPLVAAAAISILGSFGAGFYLNKQLLTGVNGELQKALAAVQTSGDHGDDHKGGGSKDAHGTTAGELPAQHRPQQPVQPQLALESDGLAHFVHDPARLMVLQVAAYAGQFVMNGNPLGFDLARRPHARQQQKMRRAESTG